jgi:hypothetical protein
MTSELMGNEKYPTVPQTLPLFNLLMNRMNGFLRVTSSSEYPDEESLVAFGVSPELCHAVVLGRNKLMRYNSLADQTPIHYIATGKLQSIVSDSLTFQCIHKNVLTYWQVVLDPRIKMEYFERLDQADVQFQSHYRKMIDIWEKNYKVVPIVKKPEALASSSSLMKELWALVGPYDNLMCSFSCLSLFF